MPRPRGRLPIARSRRLVDAVGDEALQLVAVLVEHAERRVACPGQLAGDLEHAAEDDLGVELRHEAAADLDQLPQPRLVEGPAVISLCHCLAHLRACWHVHATRLPPFCSKLSDRA